MATLSQLPIGTEVVRSKGNVELIGLVSVVTAIDEAKNRVKTTFGTWVLASAVEPTSIPYTITPFEIVKGKNKYPKYITINKLNQ